MASGTRQGGRPRFLSFGLGKLGRGPRCGALRAAAALGVVTLLAGGGIAAESKKSPYGMVPYTHPVFKNGVRVLWHGAWRGSQGRVVRQYARATALAAASAAPAPA